MVKKQKLTELDEDEDLINFVEVLDKTQVIKKSIDDFNEETKLFEKSVRDESDQLDKKGLFDKSELKETARSKEKIDSLNKDEDLKQKSFKKNNDSTGTEKKDKTDSEKNQKKQNVEPEVVIIHKKSKEEFSIDFLSGFFQKLGSYSIILIIVDLIAHFSNAVDGVDVLNPENYSSIYLNENITASLVKFLIFVSYIYVISPRNSIAVDEKGVHCMKSAIQSSFLMKTEYFHLPWENITYARQNYRLFESYLYFYDSKDEQIGMINFCLDNKEKKKFKKFITENCPKDHALIKFIKTI